MQLYGKELFDWEGIKEVPAADVKAVIIDAASQFMKKMQIQPVNKIVGPDINLQGTVPVIQIMSDPLKGPDRGYELIFDEVNMREATSDSFDLLKTTGGVYFYQHEPGEEAKLSKLPASALTPIKMVRFTGGFSVLNDWLKYNHYYKIERLTANTIKAWWKRRAQIFYGLMEALNSGINQAFVTDDVNTINAACAVIINDLKDTDFAAEENSQFIITCNPSLRGRIYKALKASYVNPNENNDQIIFNINAVVSTPYIVNTTYYVSLPGGNNLRGEWEDLNARVAQTNERLLGADHVWTGAYNGVIGEPKQHRRCALS